MADATPTTKQGLIPRFGLLLGPLIFGLLAIGFNPIPDRPEVGRMAAVAALMACWWITEAVPIPVTSLLPLVLFPALGLMATKQTAGFFMNSTIFLFLGGFLIALGVERTGLHRRIALQIVRLMGRNPRRMVLGFMLATAGLSMWISNTATAMMMLPIGISLVAEARLSAKADAERDPVTSRFALALMLGIAYGANIGGMATLIGTPPNLSLSRIYVLSFPGAGELSFFQWFLLGFPLVVVFLVVTWFLLVRLIAPLPSTGLMGETDVVREQLRSLGRMTRDEKFALSVFVSTALLWVFRTDIDLGFSRLPGWSGLIGLEGRVDDATVAIAMAIVLFVLPSAVPGRSRVMEWEATRTLPWHILLLFGGGFALAGGFAASGLTDWLGMRLQGLGDAPTWLLLAATSTLMTFMTEVTSNTATTELVLPILAGVAKAIRCHPLVLMVPAALSASCAFMLPVATPPNAIVYSSGLVPMRKMASAGLLINLIGVVLIVLTVSLLAGPALGVDWTRAPEWLDGGP